MLKLGRNSVSLFNSSKYLSDRSYELLSRASLFNLASMPNYVNTNSRSLTALLKTNSCNRVTTRNAVTRHQSSDQLIHYVQNVLAREEKNSVDLTMVIPGWNVHMDDAMVILTKKSNDEDIKVTFNVNSSLVPSSDGRLFAKF